VERFLDLLILDGKKVFDPNIELFLSDRESAAARQALSGSGVRDDERLLALAPFAADLRRTWGLERFWQVAEHFSRQGFRIVVLGAAGERVHLDAHPLPPGIGAVDLVGKLGILETAAVIQRSAAFLGNDSGLGHVAGGVGTRALILGYFITRVWYPLAPSVTTIIKDTGCRSCNLDTCLADGGTLPPCFAAIGIDEVIGTLTGMLG
jgi:ADP-heptose:LPS heptosyltransferase